MTEVRIGCIAEGHGEREAVPIVIRRIAQVLDPALYVHIPPPIRTPKSKLVKSGELERALGLAALKIQGRGGILVLLDSDAECPAQRGPELLQRATSARADLPVAVVLAKQEFEAWFLASAVSLRGSRGLSANLVPPPDPEMIQGAKEWLSRQMVGAQSYRETLDQPALAARFDLEVARRADSFDKCFREIVRLLESVRWSSD